MIASVAAARAAGSALARLEDAAGELTVEAIVMAAVLLPRGGCRFGGPPGGRTVRHLSIGERILCVYDEDGDPGLTIFESEDARDVYAESIEAGEAGRIPRRFAPHLELFFVRGADLHPSLRREITRRRWPVAGAAGAGHGADEDHDHHDPEGHPRRGRQDQRAARRDARDLRRRVG